MIKRYLERYCITPHKIFFSNIIHLQQQFLKTYIMNWKQTMTELKHQYIQSTAPEFYKASGGRTMIVKAYTDKTTNGLTSTIIDFLKFKGHYANRINCMGVTRLIKGNMMHVPSSTRKGVADIHAIINGKHCSIEIKCKATNDRMSKDQEQERSRIESAGGIYYVAQDMESFLVWYHQTFV